MQRDTIEYDHFHSTAEHQARNRVKRIELRSSGSHFGQVPSGRGSGSADSALNIEYTTSLDDAPDGPDRRWLSAPTLEQGSVDRLRSVLTKVARFGKLLTDGHHEHLHGALGAIDRTRPSSGPSTPINAVQAPAGGVTNPSLNHRQADVELTCRFTESGTGTDSLDHPFSALLNASA
jgi:hypothetical protein